MAASLPTPRLIRRRHATVADPRADIALRGSAGRRRRQSSTSTRSATMPMAATTPVVPAKVGSRA
jgi:hypothetical protein